MREKVLAYCERYDVTPGPEGLPPFPSGRRESPQHREWLTVYRALQRLKARSANVHGEVSADDRCPVCTRAVTAADGVALPRAGRPRSERLHAECAELGRLAEKAGRDAVARLDAWLWPRRRRAGS